MGIVSAGTRRSTINRRRRGLLAFIVPWLRRFGVVIVIMIVLGWIGAWLWLSGTVQKTVDAVNLEFLAMTVDMGLSVNNVLVEGRVHTDPAILSALVDVKKGDPLLKFKPRAARESIERISWVDSVRVERRWPDTIYIGIKEKTPLAIWQREGRLSLIDTKGGIVAVDDLTEFADLVIVMGLGAPEASPELLATLKAEPGVLKKVKAANYVSGRRWDLVMESDMIVRLPESDIGLALRRLAVMDEEEHILSQDFAAIDLREEDRVTVRTRPGAFQEYKASVNAVAGEKGDNI